MSKYPINDIKFFYNETPFKIPKEKFQHFGKGGKSWNYRDAFTQLDLEKFPLLEDFEIKLFGDPSENLGKHLRFFSQTRGNLTRFPWWDRVDEMMKDWSLKDIPIGTLEEPFDDLEEGWQVLIFDFANTVYILEGAEPGCEEFYTWYRVPKEVYLAEWQKVLNSLKADK